MDAIYYQGERNGNRQSSFSSGGNWDPPEDEFIEDDESTDAELNAASQEQTPEALRWTRIDILQWAEDERAKEAADLAWAAHYADKRRKQA